MRGISVKNKQKLSIYQFATDKSTKKSSMKPRVEQWRKSIKISKIYRRYIRYITDISDISPIYRENIEKNFESFFKNIYIFLIIFKLFIFNLFFILNLYYYFILNYFLYLSYLCITYSYV